MTVAQHFSAGFAEVKIPEPVKRATEAGSESPLRKIISRPLPGLLLVRVPDLSTEVLGY